MRESYRRPCRLVFVLCFLLLANAASQVCAKPPNIVLILVDDLGWADLSCYGHRWHRTPNIDALASTGMKFTNAYAPAPICSASRASILTGKAVPRLGMEFVTKNEAGFQKLKSPQSLVAPPFSLNLPLEEETIAEILGTKNYQTAFFGKWHVSQHHGRYLGWHPEFGPGSQGFEVAAEDFGDHPYAWPKGKVDTLSNGEFPQDSMVDRSVDFIRGEHDRPFFLMMSSFYVHTPVKNRCRWLVDQYEALIPGNATNRRKRLEYAAFVETLDHHVGTVTKVIKEAGITDETLVVFVSDNGGHPEFCGQAPLRGSKWNLYEGGVRVPMITSWPGKIAANSLCSTPVIGYDLLPTFAGVAGNSKPLSVDGVNLIPLFSDSNWTPGRSLIWHFPYYHPEATFSKAIPKVGTNDFAVSQTRPQSAMRKGDWKVIHFAEDDRVELYDLANDIGERDDLSERLPSETQRMRNALAAELESMNARRATPR